MPCRTRSIWAEEQEQQAAAVAAAAEALEGLDLDTLDLLSNASKAEQAQVEKALSLTHSLGSRGTAAALSLSSSLRETSMMFGPLSPAMSAPKMQQLLLSPRAAAAAGMGGGQAAAAAALLAAGGGGLPAWQQDSLHELPLEEEMTADIFGFE